MFKNSKNRANGSDRLGQMLAAGRNARSQALSAEARDEILNAVRAQAPAGEPLPALFTPVRRLILTGALPVLLAALLLVGIDHEVRTPVTEEGGLRVTVSKRGDELLFTIANGGRPHVVSRSTQPDRFEPSSAVPVADGAYSESLADQADLVFYRID